MSGLKLPKLPDRTPVRISISLSPELNRRLHSYAEFYRETYGEAEKSAELIPYMLDEFMSLDRAFNKTSKRRTSF